MKNTTRSTILDTVSLRVLSVLGVLVAGLGLVGGVFGLVQTLTSETVAVTQPVSLPVTDIVTDGPASVSAGETTFAELSVDGLSMAARLLLGGGTLLLTLVQVMIAIAVVVLCRQLLAGRPFVRALGRLVSALAVVVLAGGMVGQALYGFGNFQVATELNTEPIGSAFPMLMHLDSTPFIIGIVLAVVAMAFSVGERLQRETDGLV
ncbi:MAG: hypothetical protein ABWX65_12520 [Mycetocola sp.]